MLRVQEAVFVLHLVLVGLVASFIEACKAGLTWPAVSMISVRNVVPLCTISWLKVFSMVG